MYHSGGYVDNKGGYACMGKGVYEKSLKPSSQFCFDLKTALKKKKVFLKKVTFILIFYC